MAGAGIEGVGIAEDIQAATADADGGGIDDDGCEGADDGLDCCVLFFSFASAPENPSFGRAHLREESAGCCFSSMASGSSCWSDGSAAAASVVLASMVSLFLFQ